MFPFPTGIFVQGHKNVVIRNCTISHRAQTTWPFGNGIYFTGADNLSITDVAVELVWKTPFWNHFTSNEDQFTKTGSGQI